MIRIYVALIAVLSFFYFSACSTILNTTTQVVELKTNPPNAKISVDGSKFGTSPQTVNIARGSNHVVKFELDGFDTYEIQLTRKMSNAVWLNIFNGFVPGLIVDMFTGSMFYILPEKVEAELTPAKVVAPVKKR